MATMSEMLYRYYAGLSWDTELALCSHGFGHYWHDGQTVGEVKCPEHDGWPLHEGDTQSEGVSGGEWEAADRGGDRGER